VSDLTGAKTVTAGDDHDEAGEGLVPRVVDPLASLQEPLELALG